MHVLYLSQTGLAEPLGRSQVVPYLRGLSGLGHCFTVVSQERRDDLRAGRSEAVRPLLPPGTRWVRLTYHRTPPVVSTAYDIALGLLRGSLVRGVDLIHARSTVPALMAAGVSAVRGRPWIFDIRGFLAQEYVDAGHWDAHSWRARIASLLERSLIGRASGRVFLTRRARLRLEADGLFSAVAPTAVIPCAVDLERFVRSETARAFRRRELGVEEGTLLLVYAGSLGNWNLAAEVLRFHRVLSAVAGDSRLLLLTNTPDRAEQEVRAAGQQSTVLVRTALPDEVPSFLSAADVGVAFATPRPSRVASSPTKIAEYLACGLPVVTNSAVGDLAALDGEAPMVGVADLEDATLRLAAQEVLGRLALPDLRSKARRLAEREFSLGDAVRRYDELYRLVSDRARHHG